MKKLNLAKLRCSTASSSKGYPSSSRSSTKNQSQATISSFFINKSCSKDENKVTAKSAKSTVKVGFYCTKQSWRDCTKLKIRIIYAMLSFHYEIRPDQALLLTEDLPPTSPLPPPSGFTNTESPWGVYILFYPFITVKKRWLCCLSSMLFTQTHEWVLEL